MTAIPYGASTGSAGRLPNCRMDESSRSAANTKTLTCPISASTTMSSSITAMAGSTSWAIPDTCFHRPTSIRQPWLETTSTSSEVLATQVRGPMVRHLSTVCTGRHSPSSRSRPPVKSRAGSADTGPTTVKILASCSAAARSVS